MEDDSLEAMDVVLDEHMVISAFDLLDRANGELYDRVYALC